MSPVKPRRRRSPRSVALAVGGVLIGIVLALALFVFAIPKLTESHTIEVKLGSDQFGLGNARVKADSIAADGPFLFSDVANGQRDIYVQHVGADPLTGWLAFDAHRPGTGRECTLSWDRAAARFADPCDHSTVPADGASLPRYPVTVSSDEQISVDLKTANPTATVSTATTATGAGPDDSSTIVVTGSIPSR
jgi:hypothetical protein